MPLTQVALGYDCHENEALDISNTDFSRYGRSNIPIGKKENKNRLLLLKTIFNVKFVNQLCNIPKLLPLGYLDGAPRR